MSVFTLSHPKIKELVEISGELNDLGAVIALLSWDQETYLPARAAFARASQLETLSGIYHDKATARKVGRVVKLLSEEIQSEPQKFNNFDKALVREMRRDFEIATKLPKRLVTELSRESSLGLESWKHARTQNDFSLYEPSLAKMVKLKQEAAEVLGYQNSPYDALLDEFEEGLTKKEVQRVFDNLKPELEKRIPKLTVKTREFDHGLFSKSYDKDKLWALSLDILSQIGFDLTRGRQDESTHPFTLGLNVDDVRLTTRTLPTNPISTLMSSIHEGGHGMYEQGISPEIAHTTIGYVNSLVVHESQSRFWENMIGKSREFWEYFFPQFQSKFPEYLSGADANHAWEEANIVRPSFIRVDADEVTYHMHIIIRTEIESALIEGKLNPKEVPEKWNELYLHYLGVKVADDAQGCLQDIHWSQGLMGYFPTYSLGSIFSAQLYDQLKSENPQIKSEVAAGRFEVPLHWLNDKIHQHGRIMNSRELSEKITGKPLSADAFVRYIDFKFGL